MAFFISFTASCLTEPGGLRIWFSFIKDFVAVAVENQELAEMQRAMFVALWGKI